MPRVLGAFVLLTFTAVLACVATAGGGPALARSSTRFSHPAGIAVDGKGNIYVADWGTARIFKLSPRGKFLASWGGRGSGPGHFRNPEGIAVDREGQVYVVDQGPDRLPPDGSNIQEFTPGGKLLARWGIVGKDLVFFNHPHGVAVDSQGNVYVTDWGNNRVVKLLASGARPVQWANGGERQFKHPLGIAIDGPSNVYVVDEGASRLQELSPMGRLLRAWRTGTRFGEAPRGYGPGSALDLYGYPQGIAIDRHGDVYFTDWAHACIRKFSAHGRFQACWTVPGLRSDVTGGPSSVAVDARGAIYVTNFADPHIRYLVPKSQRFRILQ